MDEVARGERAACVTAINTYRQAHGLQPVAVCCRREEYDALPVQLDLANAVEVVPLARQDVERYLDAQGFKLARVRRALAEDAELWTLMDTPLMLTVLFLASAAEAEGGTPEPDPRRRLYRRYVEAMSDPRNRRFRFGKTKTLRWLGWLAAEMSNRNQIPFALEDLEPSWLPSGPVRRALKWLVGLGVGLAGGLALGREALTADMRPVDALRTDRDRLPKALVGGLILGLVSGPVLGLVVWLLLGLGVGLVVGLVGGLGLGLFFGLDEALRPAQVSERSNANEGTRRSLRYALYIASAGLVFSLVWVWGGYALGGRLDTAELGMADAFGFIAPTIAFLGAWIGLRKGGYFALRHGIVRALLRRLNLAPWAYVSFLDEAKDHLFLRKTGGVYQFFHVTFRDFMAETYGADWLAEPPPPDPATLAADAS